MEDSVLSRNRKLFVTNLRYGKTHFQQLREKPEPGDLIEISRIGSSHWALYVGDDYVIHLAPPGADSHTDIGVVKKEFLQIVVGNCSYKVNNHLDHLYKPRLIKDMLRSASQMVGKEMEYSDLSRNSEHFVTDLRYGKASSRQFLKETKPGDLIEISRIGSSHWALYVGDGYVIHLAPLGEISGVGTPTGLGVVKRQLLKEVLENCSYEVNNHLDHLYKPRPIKDMLRSAEEMVGQEMEYSDLSRNSEKFVTDLRYGTARSWQFHEEPKPGDLIEISCIGYSHWALYEGNGYVIHLAPPGEKSEAGIPTSLGVVKTELLVDVVENCFYKINNHLDHLYKPQPIDDMLRSAAEMVGQEMEYSVLSRSSENFVTHLRYGKASSRRFLKETKPGDLIEISRIGSSHWALYVGDGYVIHLAPLGEISGVGTPTGLGVVKRQLLKEVLENCSYEVNNHLDHLYKPRPIKDMLRSAEEMVGQEMEYSDLSRNSEKFVTDLRYGTARSWQFHEEPKPGDLIEISCIGYSHWALYEGNGYVIHLAPPGEKSEAGIPTSLGVVKTELLVDVVENCFYKINNHLDHLYKPQPIDDMLRSAAEMVGQEMEYSVLSRSSENFVTHLRYGKASSRRFPEEPEPGDLIGISSIGSSHWAHYEGDGHVIHLAPPGENSESGAPTSLGVVKRELLVDVVENCFYKVQNHLDHLYKTWPIKDMLGSAAKMVGKEMEDSDLSMNSEHFVTDLRYGKANSQQLHEEPEPGDLIEILHIGSSYWALYEGDGYVIHLAPPGEKSEAGTPTGLGVVKRELLLGLVENSNYKVNNYLDSLYKPRPVKEILRSAEEMVGKEMEYSVLSRNSEHFVTILRYGESNSRQLHEEPNPGDLIEISQMGSSHWALYMGNGYVIHLAPPGENLEAGTSTGLGVVKRELLLDVVGNFFYQVNNHLDHLYKPRPIKEMLSSGKEMFGMEMEYSVLSRSSEHLVTNLRYGKAYSRKFCEEPKPGDLIEISRIGSSYWALYVGDGYVIHLAPPGEKSEAGAPTGLGVVKRQYLAVVLENCSYKVNNQLDQLYKPRPIHEMIRSGKEMVGKEMKYSALSENNEHLVTDLRYGKAGSRQFREEPKPGDLIEISRIGSSHWALYEGDGYVIHLAPPEEKSEAGTPTGLGVVKSQLLKEVLESCSYEVNNHLDHLYKPRPIMEMLTAAEEMVGQEMEYSVLSRNSEHFVTDLRYGKAISRQLREEPKPGDLIEIFRFFNSHWALYVGDGYVIHLAPPGENSESGAPTALGVVKRELLVDVVGQYFYKVNNHLDHLYKPRPIKDMLRSGIEMVGTEMEYSVLSRNYEHLVTELRYGKTHSRQFCEEPKPGDLIEISCIGYSHWALYEGDGYVIHLAPPEEKSEPGAPTGLGVVKRELLVDVAENCSYKVNNNFDSLYKPRPIKEMLRSGKEMVGKELEDSDLRRNSEDFVTDLRYGKACSRQFCEEPKPGDLIEILHIGPSHWALYVGDGYVIHLAPPGENSESGAPTGLGVVKRELLVDVVGQYFYKVNNHLDHLYKPRPIEEMLGSTGEMVGQEMEYSDLSMNSEHFVTDLRYGKARIHRFCEEPKPGDLIEILHIGPSHWALYVGDGYVIHLAPPGENSESGAPTGLGVVKRELLVDVVGQYFYKVNNHLDHLYKPRPIEEMLGSTGEMVGQEMEYSDLSMNSEHFVTDLRYGKARIHRFCEEAKPGDLIEISRIGSSHWALYEGDGYVIYLAPLVADTHVSDSTVSWVVKRELLLIVVENCSYMVNNHLDHLYKPQPIKKILNYGEEMVGAKMKDNDLRRRSEHIFFNLRYGMPRNRQFREEPKPGDLIEISHIGSSHWVLYMGDGFVIHLAPPEENSEAGSPTVFEVVKRELLVDVAGNCSYTVNNYLDQVYTPWPTKKIIALANLFVGRKTECPVLSRNCKQFVTDLRYGNKRSWKSKEEPMPGDMIEISHQFYCTWALYVGEGDVIHLAPRGQSHSTGFSNLPMFLSGQAEVTKEPLQKAASGSPYKVNNYLDHKYRPRPVDEIITSAEKMIGKQKSYLGFLENHQRFVADLRYGSSRWELSSDDPMPGDLLEISQGVHKHWAIYVGNGFVIHAATKGVISWPSCSSNVCDYVVKREPLRAVAEHKVKVNNYLDNQFRPRPGRDIVSLARKKVGETWNDNLCSPTVSTLLLN